METTLGKRDLARVISQTNDLSAKEAEDLVESLFAHLADTLQGGGKVMVRGFGVFEPRFREPRLARNPRTGQKVQVGRRLSVLFRASKSLRLATPENEKKPNGEQLTLF